MTSNVYGEPQAIIGARQLRQVHNQSRSYEQRMSRCLASCAGGQVFPDELAAQALLGQQHA